MVFRDRLQAARKLLSVLSPLVGKEEAPHRPLVLGIPRGAVPMAKIIADALGAELDLVLVHKFTLAHQPEFAVGSVSENGQIYLNPEASSFEKSEVALADAASRAIFHLQAKRRLYTPHRQSISMRGRQVIIVDDGIATGSTALAAVRFVKQQGALSVIVATPVASKEAVQLLQEEGAEVVASFVPERFYAVSQFFDDFSEVTDREVVRALSGEYPETTLHLGDVDLKGFLHVPEEAHGLVLFSHGSGSGRNSLRNQFVAKSLFEAGFATLLVDLLNDEESQNRDLVFDIEFLTSRLLEIENWIVTDPTISELPLGVFGASTGAAAAMAMASDEKSNVCAIVSRGGRPDLDPRDPELVRAPTLFLVGEEDKQVLIWNREVFARLKCTKELIVILGATHLFEEPGTLEQVAAHAQNWFERHLHLHVPNPSRLGLAGSEFLTNP
jgi:putative phosphoribosyl transferase